MSVSSTTNQVIYTGSGTTGPFDFTFKIYANTDLLVQKYTIASDTSTDLVLTTDYTVTINGDLGGTVTLTASLSSSYKLVITRQLPMTQAINYVPNDPFPAETHEEGLDRAAMRDQQLQEQLDRAVKVVAGSSTTPENLIDSLNTASDAAVAAQAAAEAAATTATAAAGSITFFWGGTSGGSANAQTLTPTPSIASYVTGYRFAFKAGFTNSGACTINISGLGTKSLVSQGGAALISGQIITGNVYMIVYDGTNFYVDEIMTSANGVSGAALYSLASIPAGAGVIPAANIPSSSGIYFQAGASSGQSISHNVDTKIALATEDFDSHNYFDNATNYRFTPLTAGKYVITSRILGSNHDTTNQYWTLRIKKNGSTNVSVNSIQPKGSGASDEWSVITSTIVSFNGTTDYVETYVQQTNTGTASKTLGAGSIYVCFFGYKIGD
jgi:hypothetical protein